MVGPDAPQWVTLDKGLFVPPTLGLAPSTPLFVYNPTPFYSSVLPGPVGCSLALTALTAPCGSSRSTSPRGTALAPALLSAPGACPSGICFHSRSWSQLLCTGLRGRPTFDWLCASESSQLCCEGLLRARCVRPPLGKGASLTAWRMEVSESFKIPVGQGQVAKDWGDRRMTAQFLFLGVHFFFKDWEREKQTPR